ncbi:MAG: hypothetical protein A3C93_05635 [Candidatus Lloydbacteria bacterium RIFCSPHIGHO2_02_FULL_54_17]|uniref:Uncharacterized protein n=1 Tax=Candidatus Lloydbacteria bacterium RIFCSPHIGHO2_02_FULL_54_17 TaxID=1798664 RepID=A0A1G2DAW0_9BACT|nr:MAG: hypothetical protein A2762_03105 [Candidatus Lloydbacteria bacterium RIFCSPHIGHO2_01_FULL_54_11]OGZ10769.1 MAG: hypothetical protein A3C93_05635 [Candidatus Lloydbacteria bacterium RIFCSPHIGHO2_02_FULL_54_17]OGZ13070.1 MAG: hypothetical protein A2948_03615 [Candidatus Lloydbacteria bacterium RIFCSPLOWO2_01_FULL_54_18]OGZ16518.1 MAG: hypothetical protein A3H76_04475 [Candidatus Lloydbacteria bacterium RIFCSPLOWO2_02_FULL_54_12]
MSLELLVEVGIELAIVTREFFTSSDVASGTVDAPTVLAGVVCVAHVWVVRVIEKSRVIRTEHVNLRAV